MVDKLISTFNENAFDFGKEGLEWMNEYLKQVSLSLNIYMRQFEKYLEVVEVGGEVLVLSFVE